jgi:hypothetical protein
MKIFFTFRVGPFAFYAPVSEAQMLLVLIAIAAALGAFFWHEMLFEAAHPHHHPVFAAPLY